jgi:sugar O-acyltransferase (sialic acid O-acetyltransferase NeuD family)
MTTCPLIIVGAGGFGRESAAAVRAINRFSPTWDLLGFADDDRGRRGAMVEGIPVLGPIEEVASAWPEARLVVCTGRPDNYFSRPKIVAELGLPSSRYATLVHPAASVGDSCVLGPGTVVLAGTVLTAAATVGAHVAIMPGSVITHDDMVGDFATLASGVLLGGSVTIGTGAYMGAGSRVREGLSVGDWAMIGMGSLLTRSVPARERWFGSPARPMGAVEAPLPCGSR